MSDVTNITNASLTYTNSVSAASVPAAPTASGNAASDSGSFGPAYILSLSSGAAVDATLDNDSEELAEQKVEAEGVSPPDSGFIVDKQGNIDQIQLQKLLASLQSNQG